MVEQSDFCRLIARGCAVRLVDDDEDARPGKLLDPDEAGQQEFFFWIILFVKGQLDVVLPRKPR